MSRPAGIPVSPKRECIDCAKRDPRPSPWRKIDPRSLESHKSQPRCATDWRAWDRARRQRVRTRHKAKTYGISRELQVILWEYQGSSCPCGRKAAKEIPPGVTLDHEHTAPCIIRGDHDEKSGCMECVTGFLCTGCNRETVGRLERAFQKLDDPRPAIADALHAVANHLTNPPLTRLLAERPDLLEQAS